MPKKFSDEELLLIRRQLLDTGKALFERHGFKKTSIDQIVYDVGIAKGSFYKFFKNKESLFLQILEAIEIQMHNTSKHMLNMSEDMSLAFMNYVKYQLSSIKNEPLFLTSMDTMFTASIWSRLSPEDFKRSENIDHMKMREIRSIINKHGYDFTLDDKVLSGVLRSLVFMLIHTELMGEHTDDVIDYHLNATIKPLIRKRTPSVS